VPEPTAVRSGVVLNAIHKRAGSHFAEAVGTRSRKTSVRHQTRRRKHSATKA